MKWVEFWERLFFRGLCWSRPLMVFLAKVEVRTRLMQRHLESPLIYIGEALAGMGELPRVRVASAQDDGKKLTFCGRDDLKPEAGQYEGCQIYLGLAKGDSPEREAVYIPMGKLIVE